MKKLENFPRCYCITLEESKDRQRHLYHLAQKYSIKPFNLIISQRFDQCNDVIHGPFVHTLNSSNKGASTSHLKAIKKWLSETDESEKFALFFEDDVSFETVDYWNFTWQEFVDNLPKDWEAMHLMWVRPHMVKIELRERYPDDWSATAFMITRDYGRKLLERFMIGDNEFNYDLGNLQPIVENVMFTSGKVYTCPLFVEATQLLTTFMNAPEYDSKFVTDGQGEGHHDSRTSVLNWWKDIGVNVDVKDLMNTKLFPVNFDWGKFSPELISSLKKEIGRENIYERFNSVKEGDVVLDIGASVGPFSHSILPKKPEKLYCVEPSKDLFISLVKNTSSFSVDTPIIYVNKAISDDGEAKVFSGNENIYGGNNDYEVISFDNLIQEYNISKVDFLKLDCEGGEYDIFNDNNIEWIVENVKYIAAEFHLTYTGHKEMFKNFRDRYLQRFKSYVILSNINQNILPGYELNLSRWIFDDLFLDNYHGELMIYIKNF